VLGREAEVMHPDWDVDDDHEAASEAERYAAHVEAEYQAYARDTQMRDEVRREMLWLMAIAGALQDVLAFDYETAGCGWYASRVALRALADLGDQRAIDILGGEG
jgi:hypothetical protein